MKKIYFIIALIGLSLSSISQTFNGATGPITDNNCDVSHDFPVTVSGVGILGSPMAVNEIKFDISHTYDADLDIYLVAPNGVSVELSTDNGDSSDNFTNTIISNTATQSITSGTAPFTGSYTPEGDLSTLSGINANGIWILRVCDDAGTDVGTLNNWSLSFNSLLDVTPDNVNLLAPSSYTISQSGYFTVYGQIIKTGLTDITVAQNSSIQAWVGYSTTNTNPATWTSWIPATFNQNVGNRDEYKAIIGPTLAQGTYYYATRFKISGGYYYYGGTSDGLWDGITHNSGVLTVNPPMAPVNDNCAGAIALVVNPDYSCGIVTPGSVMSATASPVDGNSCAGAEDDDTWFSFVATATTHRISLTNVSGNTTDMFHSLWTGNCNSLSLVAGSCSDADVSNPAGLIVGQTYYLRVNTVISGPTTTVFNVCVGTLPLPPTSVKLVSPAAATIAPGGSVTVIGQILKTGVTDLITGQTPGFQGWIGYSTSNTNPNTWTNWALANFNLKVAGSDEYKANLGALLAPGTYYYVIRFQQTGGEFYYGGINSSNNGGFWDGSTYQSGLLTINQPQVPSNDNCIGAIPLTIGNVFNDNAVTGTTYGAIDSAFAAINCDGTLTNVNSSVYYSVIIPPSGSVTIETKAAATNSLTDTVMLASIGSCDSLIGMACNNNYTGSFSQLNMFGQTPGSTLYIAVYKNGNTPPDVLYNQFKISAYTAVLGTDVFDSSKFVYFPNPVKDFLNLSSDTIISNIEVFNLIGQKVCSNRWDSNEVKMDMSNLPKGLYMVNVMSNFQTKTLKIVKE